MTVDAQVTQSLVPGGPHLIRGMDEAAVYISNNFFPCTVRYVKAITGTKNGDLPYFKIAGRRHYDPADIARWVASRRLASHQELSA
jgi:hypothetical protein